MASSTKDLGLSKGGTWASMSERKASLARLDSPSTTSSQSEGPILQTTLQAILNPSRLAALEAADVSPIPYNTRSFFSYAWSLHGRNLRMLVAPLLSLFLFGLVCQLLLIYVLDDDQQLVLYDESVQDFLASMDDLIAPLLTPLSFMVTFRLARAAVRYWDARASAGKMVEICRSHIAVVYVGLMSPIRLAKKQKNPKHANNEQDERENNGGGENEEEKALELLTKKQKKPEHANYEQNERANNDGGENEEEKALELLCEYARWLAVYPIAVKYFLRPKTRKGWAKDARFKKRRYEIGPLLTEEDARNVIMEHDDENGKPTMDAVAGTRVRDAPLVVLNRLHRYAYDIAHFKYTRDSESHTPTPQQRAIFYQQMNDQLNVLYGAYGAMERIKGTPLPFAYAIHLRTFLLLYLFLWNMVSVARYGWVSLPFLFAMNWGLLGIEAASVECEQPFEYNPNHLTLGKVSVVIAGNIAQALREVETWLPPQNSLPIS